MEQLSPDLSAIQEFLQSEVIKKKFDDILGAKAPAFIINVMQVVIANTDLHKADHNSICNAAVEIALLGLPLSNNLQYAHIASLEKEGKIYAQFNIGWRGLVQLAQRTDKFKTINVVDVREGELINNDLLTGVLSFKWEQVEAKRKTLPIIGWVSYFELLTGFQKSNYKTVEALEEHGAKYSKTFKTGNWSDNKDAMCAKTVIKKLLSDWAPLSDHVEISRAIKADQSIITEEGKYTYMDNPATDNKAKRATGKDKAANAVKEVTKLLQAGVGKKQTSNEKKK